MALAGQHFASLSPDLLVEVLSCITYDSAQLAWFGSLCRTVSQTLGQDDAWRHLCRRYWYATDSRLQEWPTLSPQGLYRALEQWAPLEGYYVLAPVFPWGLLVLVRMAEGRVLADVIRFVPQKDAGFLEILVPLFRVTLKEEQPGLVRSALDASWLGGAPAHVGALEPQQLEAALPVGKHFSGGVAQLFQARRALRVAASEPAARYSEGLAAEDAPLEPGRLPESPEAAEERTEAMLQQLLGRRAVPCDLALVRSPADFCPREANFPGVRPGLYVGDYGHNFYGQYRTEVLLVEYVALSREELSAEMEQPVRVFARPGGEPAPPALRRLMSLPEGATFVRGVKQCGDMHVPMGAATFVAVCGPPEACQALGESWKAPSVVLNRQSGEHESVQSAWRGFGTLAGPGFGNPTWSCGWLVQLAGNSDSGDHRFGFMWDRHQDAVVLSWVKAQDSSPFLQRAWLPEGLQ